MITQWKQTSVKNGIQHYKATNCHAKAWIKHNDDGTVASGSKYGLFGLGMQIESIHSAPAPSDDVVLKGLDRDLNSPRFEDWRAAPNKSDDANTYKGKANNFLNSNVKATITRKDDEADVHVKVGLFGTEIDGHFFAPAPSDLEILSRVSQRH